MTNMYMKIIILLMSNLFIKLKADVVHLCCMANILLSLSCALVSAVCSA